MLGMDSLKNTVVRQLGAEEYSIVTEVLNGQIERLEECLELADIEHEKAERFEPEKLEEAVDKAGVDQALNTVLKQFDQKMKKLEAQILIEQDVEKAEIRGFING